MNKFYTNNYSDINLYRKKSSKSEIMTQMIYGDIFFPIKRSNKWWKIKIKDDGYVGFIKKRNFIKSLKSTHKVSKLSAKIYKKPNFKNLRESLHLEQGSSWMGNHQNLLSFKIIG